MIIDAGSVWVHKDTGEKAFVLWASKELVTYRKDGDSALIPVRKFVFMQDYVILGECDA